MSDEMKEKAAARLINAGMMWLLIIFTLGIAASVILLCTHCKNSSRQEADLYLNSPPDLTSMNCDREGVITRTEPLGDGEYDVVLVHTEGEDDDVQYGALAHKQNRFQVGDRVKICHLEILRQTRGRQYNPLSLAKRIKGEAYNQSWLDQLCECEDGLEQVDQDLEICMDFAKECVYSRPDIQLPDSLRK